MHHGTLFRQPLGQRTDVTAEVRKLLIDREIGFGHHEDPLRRAALRGIAEPEHLCQRHRCICLGVPEHPQDHRIGGGVAQSDGLGRPGGLISLGLVVTEDIRPKRTFPQLGAGGLVVGDSVGRQQQCGDRIHHGRLARPDIAGEQTILPAEPESPDPLVKRPPVVDLDPIQPISGFIGDLRRILERISRWGG